VPDTTNGDTLGKALNICNMVSKHISGEGCYHVHPKREIIAPITHILMR
jgi:hypothetical protein